MKSILAFLPMFMQQIGSSERDYILPRVINELKLETARVGLTWTDEQCSVFSAMAVDLFIMEQIHGANQLLAKVNAK